MGFLSPSSSICYFQVCGSTNNQSREEMMERLSSEGFRSIENSAEELATGWVESGDYDSSDFDNQAFSWRDHWLCFTLRQDRRKIPAALLKRQIAIFCDQFLAEKPTLSFIPKAEKEQIRDRARSLLLAKTLPAPSFYDATWNTETHVLRLCTLGQNAIDSFQGLFHQTFPGLRLQMIHPLARARQVLPESLHETLDQADQSQTDSLIEKIEANRWLGFDFLRWLLFRTLDSDSRYQVLTEGPLLDKQPFTAYLDNRLVLIGGGHEGLQKIVVAGPQDHYLEVKAALQQGKEIEEATILFQLEEDDGWKLTLKGDRFQFGSYRTPMIRPESDPNDDPLVEQEAAFFTKLGAVEEGEQLFGSLLRTFLELRLSDNWKQARIDMEQWLKD